METKSMTIFEMINEVKSIMELMAKTAKEADLNNDTLEYHKAVYNYQNSAQMLYELQIESLTGQRI